MADDKSYKVFSDLKKVKNEKQWSVMGTDRVVFTHHQNTEIFKHILLLLSPFHGFYLLCSFLPYIQYCLWCCVLLWEADPRWMPGAQQATPSLPEQDRAQVRIRQKKKTLGSR